MDPPDWADLSMFGMYCLEAAVDAACMHFGIPPEPQHHKRVGAARELTQTHGLPDIAELLVELNTIRKSEAYGDIEQPPELDAEDVARVVEGYLDAVESAIGGRNAGN